MIDTLGVLDFDFELLRKVIKLNGKEEQKYIAIEEMAELQKEICKDKRGYDNYPNLVEEVADVLIMLVQLIIIYDIPMADLQKEIDFKQDRLKKILEGEL